MPADVCLLLMQSLTGDCETLPPSMGDPIAPITEPTTRGTTATIEMVPAAIAPTQPAVEPRFGVADCEANADQHLLACLEPVQQRQLEAQIGNMVIPSAATAPVVPTVSEVADVVPADLFAEIAIPEASVNFPQPKVTASPAISPKLSPLTAADLGLTRPVRSIALAAVSIPQFSPPMTRRRPTSGPQLYRQRKLALQTGQLYTRLSPSEFDDEWSQATQQPTYQDWLQLLASEGRAAAAGQGSNRLEVVLGDSLGMWLPPDTLPRDRLWLNQGISGDTTAGILQRLTAFANTRPTTIHLLAGVNDLKNGVPEATIALNLQSTVQRLQQQHPQAHIVMYSVFPTRRADITNDRVRSLNQRLTAIAHQASVEFRDVHSWFQDPKGDMRSELTTDGLHLNARGYDVWRRSILADSRQVVGELVGLR